MDNLVKLKERIDYLLEKYQEARADKLRAEQVITELKNKLQLNDKENVEFARQQKTIAREANVKNKIALKKVSKLIDRIEQLQSEIEIS